MQGQNRVKPAGKKRNNKKKGNKKKRERAVEAYRCETTATVAKGE
jgi:hypothetical protein